LLERALSDPACLTEAEKRLAAEAAAAPQENEDDS
jgi:hypothetical protein